MVTWKFGCRDFEQHEAREYCQSMGMEPVSLDTPDKQNEFNRLIAQVRVDTSRDSLTLTMMPSGRPEVLLDRRHCGSR